MLTANECACGLLMVPQHDYLLCSHCDYPCSRRNCERCNRIKLNKNR